MNKNITRTATTIALSGLLTISCSTPHPVSISDSHSEEFNLGRFSYNIKNMRVANLVDFDTIESGNYVQKIRPDEVVLTLKSTTQLEAVLKAGNLELIEQAKYPAVPPSVDTATGRVSNQTATKYTYAPIFLTKAKDLDSEDLSDMESLAAKHRYKGNHSFGTRRAAALLHRVLKISESLADGSTASVNSLTPLTDATREGAFSANGTAEWSPSQGQFWHTGPIWYGAYYGCNFNDPAPGGDSVWNYANGSSVNVAVIDGGFQGANEASMSQYIVGKAGTYYYYNFMNPSANFAGYDLDGGVYHGRKCASLIFGPNHDNGSSVGAAPNATPFLLIASGTYYLASAITAATDWGCKVTSISRGAALSDTSGTTDPMYSAVKYANTNNNVVVASAGNDGDQINFFPGGYSQFGYAVCVGAHNKFGSLSHWSSVKRSNTKNVNIYAPGGGNTNSNSYSASGWDVPAASVPSKPAYTYDYFNGTSCATPLVAGVVALLKQQGRVTNTSNTQNFFQYNSTYFPVGLALDGVLCVN